ncbi:universal stress protein [Rhizobiales bacterium RZME27]|uniref:Universal stress protein n=1 Tax=Endobacterium cereale TaxID=2663029 RepID=A0A6A8AFF0_9HYPH|nr:universal stress protein [Endobacterium cereale]MEB2843889.1 universal stress protein [Endobacterium cereale]MQY49499.1 universal stress protein [Endobacterium cereale]
MSYKTIMAVLDDPASARQISDFASFLSERFSAHIVGVHAETLAAVPLIAPMEIPDPAAVQVLQEAAQRETSTVEKIFRDRIESQGVPSEWRSFVSANGYASGNVIENARAVDLIVASQGNPPQGGPDNHADLEAFLFESGRPMLLVPRTIKEPQPIRRVLIAWNGSREATRATFDALPFLKNAESVEIFCVDPPETSGQMPEMAGVELAATLSRHGVNVTLRTEHTSGIKASAAIENRLADSSVDLLVMGGYGHARWWEVLFGGVTRTLLDSMTALTLLSR